MIEITEEIFKELVDSYVYYNRDYGTNALLAAIKILCGIEVMRKVDDAGIKEVNRIYRINERKWKGLKPKRKRNRK